MHIMLFKYFVRLVTTLLLIKYSLALYDNHKYVIQLRVENFDKLVVNSEEIWLVEFYAPWCGYCINLVPEYSKAAYILRGVAKVGALDGDQYRELAVRYNIRGFPSIRIFGINKTNPEEYTGQKTAKELSKVVLKAIKEKVSYLLQINEVKIISDSDKKYVIQLTDKNFNNLVKNSKEIWMVLFYAPWCGHCQNLEPHWNDAAKQLKNKVKFGSYDCTLYNNKSKEYRVQAFPTVKLFVPKISPIDYDGGRNTVDIVFWVKNKMEEYLQPPDIVQIINKNTVFQECEDKNFAIISFFPDILDCKASCRISYLKILKNLSERLKRNKWCWLWSEAHAQPEVENVLQVGGSGYPTLVAVDYKKGSFLQFVGAFTEQNLHSFLVNLYAGKVQKLPILVKSFPKIFDVERWNGEEIEVPASDGHVEL